MTMPTVAITDVDAATARRLYKEYRDNRHFERPIDAEIRGAYRAIAKGQMVIKALESIAAAGANEQGLPKLAICQAHHQRAVVKRTPDGSFAMADVDRGIWGGRASPNRVFRFPAGTLPPMPGPNGSALGRWWPEYEAIVPLVPARLRPKASLENYHILWEAEWNRTVPKDPMLLRRLGEGDLWIVLAAWDLTEVERAALQARVRPN